MVQGKFEIEVPIKVKGEGGKRVGESIADAFSKSFARKSKGLMKGIGLGEVAVGAGIAAETGILGKGMSKAVGWLAVIGLAIQGLSWFIKPVMRLLNVVLMLLFLPLIPILKPVLMGLAWLIRAMILFMKKLGLFPGQKKSLLAEKIVGIDPIANTKILLASLEAAWGILKKAGQWIWDHILKPAWEFLKEVGVWIWEQIILPGWEFLKDVGMWIWEQILLPAWMFLSGVGMRIWHEILLPAWEYLSSVGQKIWDEILKPAWDWFSDIGQKIWDDILKPAWDWFSDIGTKIWDIIKLGLDSISDLGEKIWNWIKSALGSILGGGKRAEGGPVTGGTPYLVGEKGPEIFMPGVSGTIIPNNKLGGNISININNPTVRQDQDIKRIANEVSRVLQRQLTGRVSTR